MPTPRLSDICAMEADTSTAYTPCPQCGVPILIPPRGQIFACTWCGSTLQVSEGVPLHYLVERPRLNRREAEELARGRLGVPVPGRMRAASISFDVGAVCYFPYLRVRREGKDEILPLAALPTVDLFDLAEVPADLQPLKGCLPQGAEQADEALVRARLRESVADGATQGLSVEYRAYYPVAYTAPTGSFSALVPGAGGGVWAARRPARHAAAAEKRMSAGVATVLFAEALLLPGLWPRVLAVLITAVLLFLALRWVLARRG